MPHTFINMSFEEVDGSVVMLTAAPEPYALSDGLLATFVLNGETLIATVREWTTASILTGGVEPFNVNGGETLDYILDGAPGTINVPATLVTPTGDIDFDGSVSALELTALLATVGGTFATVEDGAVRWSSASAGLSTIAATGGTAAAALGWPDTDTNTQTFADVGDATTAELVTYLPTLFPSLSFAGPDPLAVTAPDGVGSSTTLAVVPSSFQLAMGFTTDEATGVDYQGYPRGWTVVSTATNHVFADFDAHGPDTGVEQFSYGWSDNHLGVTSLDSIAPSLLATATFDGLPYEEFDAWDGGVWTSEFGGGETLVLEAGETVETFGPSWAGADVYWALDDQPTEEVDWSSLAPGEDESFDNAWGGHTGPIYAAVEDMKQEDMVFGDGSEYENFDTPIHPGTGVVPSYQIRILPAVSVGEAITLYVNGYKMTIPFVDPPTTAGHFALAVSNSTQPVSGYHSGGGSTEFIITQDRPGDPIDVTFDPPHAFEFVLDDHVNPSTSWTGRSANPGL